MAKHANKARTVGGGTQFFARRAAGGQNQTVRSKFAGGGFDVKTAFFAADVLHFAAQFQLGAAAGEGKAQHIHHAGGLVGMGIAAAVRFADAHKTQLFKVVKGFLHIEGLQGIKIRAGLRMIVRVFGVQIGQVAPAVAGGGEFAAHPGLAFKHAHTVAGDGSGGEGGDHAGRTCANHNSLHSVSPFLQRLLSSYRTFLRFAMAKLQSKSMKNPV